MAKKRVEELETPEERLAAVEAAMRVFFWKPYPWQERLIAEMRGKNTAAAIASNKIGKTGAGACIVCSWALGYEPWHNVEPDDPDGICVGGVWYRKSSLGIEPPVNIVITGEDWKLHLGRVIVPELKKWCPQGFYKTKKNEQGVEFLWEWDNGSMFTLMSYTQDDDLFESFRIQGVWEDEPPPKSKHTAMSRGLLIDNGKTMMTLTPLKEAWILDEIVLSGRKDIGIVDNLMITDNPDLYDSDVKVLRGLGLGEIEINTFFDRLLYENKDIDKPVIDKGRSAEAYLEGLVPEERHKEIFNLKILKFIKDIDPDDVPARVFGKFRALVGRVLKDFSDDIHAVEPFKVPTDWPVVPMIDFHLSTPQAVSYWAVNRQDISYCVAETWENIDGHAIVDDIVRKVKRFGWSIQDAYIDPLSKGDTAYMKNRIGFDAHSTFEIIYNGLSKHGITLHIASKDKDSGIKNIQTALKGPNGLPTTYIFNDCERHLFEVRRWVFDDDGKPIKENDHFMENWYRFTLTGTKYNDHVINPLPTRHFRAVAGSWMGA